MFQDNSITRPTARNEHLDCHGTNEVNHFSRLVKYNQWSENVAEQMTWW